MFYNVLGGFRCIPLRSWLGLGLGLGCFRGIFVCSRGVLKVFVQLWLWLGLILGLPCSGGT